MQRALVTAIREYCKRSQGFPRGPLAEAPSSRAAFLEAFPCLNPFSAATLSGLPCTLQQLLHKPLAELRLAAPEVPERSLSLFLRQAAWGQPVRGVHAAGRSCYSHDVCSDCTLHPCQLTHFPACMAVWPLSCRCPW